MKRIRQATVIALIAFAAYPYFSIMALENRFVRELPKTPDASSGRVNEIIIMHGSHFFANDEELKHLNRLNALFFCGVLAIFAAGAIVNGNKDDFYVAGWDTPRKRML